MKEYRADIAYELFFVVTGAILAGLGGMILHYMAESAEFARLSFNQSNMTNNMLPLDPMVCATINFQIVYVTFLSGIIAAIPLIFVGRAWVYGKMDLNIKRYLWFPAVGIALHLLYFFYQHLSNFDTGCLTRLNVF